MSASVALATHIATACAPSGDGAAISTPVLAIVDASVIPMDSERVLSGQTLIVRDGRIAAIGPADSVAVPRNAVRVEGSGKYVLPGLTDAHVHLRDTLELLSYLAHGVTTVVHLSGPTGAIADVVDLRDRVNRGEITGPAIHTSGRILDGAPPVFAGVSLPVATPEDARSAVLAQRQAGVDLVKIYNNLREAELRAAAQVAADSGLRVWGHIPRVDGRATALRRALEAGLDVIAHGEEIFFTQFYDDVEAQVNRGTAPAIANAKIVEASRLIREHDAWVIPNLSFVAMTRVQLDSIDAIWNNPELRYLSTDVRAMWREQNVTRRQDLARFDLREQGKREVVRLLTKALHAAGVPLLLGTDASAPGMFPGRSAHLELAELVMAGLSPYEALVTATRNPGVLLRSTGEPAAAFGAMTVGSRADLLLLDANPLTDIRNVSRIQGVVVRGTWYPRVTLDSMRTARIRN